jgi:hypothetical protein
MSKKIFILYFIINIAFIFSANKFPNYIIRDNSYEGLFDCFEYNNTNKSAYKIKTADDCFKESPRTKWKCCYFEYYIDDDKGEDNVEPNKGCMRVIKGNKTDLNDLKYFVSRLSSETVFNCKQNYLIYSFGISLALLLFLI